MTSTTDTWLLKRYFDCIGLADSHSRFGQPTQSGTSVPKQYDCWWYYLHFNYGWKACPWFSALKQRTKSHLLAAKVLVYLQYCSEPSLVFELLPEHVGGLQISDATNSANCS